MKKLDRVLIFVIFLFLLYLVVGGKKLFHSYGDSKQEYQYISLFSEVVSLVRTDYVESVKPGTKFPGAYSAMIDTVDRRSAYLDAEKTQRYKLYLEGRTCSSGIWGSESENYFLVTDIDNGSPAEKAGLKPGDMIRGVDGKNIFGASYWEMMLALLTEKPGKQELILIKKGGTDPVKVELETVSMEVPTAPVGRRIGDDVLLIELPRIDSANAASLEQLLQNESDVSKLIIDLRKYSGGNMEGFIHMTRLFFQTETRLILQTKPGEKIVTLGSNTAAAYRVAVILNPSTLLYGELLAVLFKHHSMTLVGERTQGFISQLKHFPLSDGSSILLTEGLFMLDGEKSVDTGLEPDIAIKTDDERKLMDRCITVLETQPSTTPSVKGKTKTSSQSHEETHERTPEKK